jgi:hypothetical protein
MYGEKPYIDDAKTTETSRPDVATVIDENVENMTNAGKN